MTVALLVVGVVAEFVGIVCLGFPDFIPGATRLSRWLRGRSRRVENRLRRLVGLPLRPVVYQASIGGAITLGGSVSGVVGTSATTIEEKVEYLLRRDQDAQRQANELAERVGGLERETSRRLDEARQRMEAHVASELATAHEEYRPLRIVGTVALAIGLVCVTLATFLA